MALLRICNASQVVMVCAKGEKILRGASMQNIAVLQAPESGGLSVVVDSMGRIAAVGGDKEVDSQLQGCTYQHTIDATGMCVLPGLVDAHTHPVWVGDRVHEFAMKRLNTMLKGGTTLVEAKSGYGLDLENEYKMLRVIEKAKQEHPITISSTYCGAHAVPRGSTAEEAARNVIDVQIPALKDLCSSNSLTVDNVDVFCEKGVFDTDTSRQILKAGQEAGWKINFHGDELHPMNSGELAAELGAHAVSHLEHVSPAGIEAMAQAGVVGVLLPTTAYILRIKPPPARDLIDKEVAVALGSDFNPNAYCMSMPLVMHLACVNLRMTMNEALSAATINAAASLGLSEEYGSLEVGKWGDMIIINATNWEHLIYQFGCHDDIIKYVIKAGRVVHTNTN